MWQFAEPAYVGKTLTLRNLGEHWLVLKVCCYEELGDIVVFLVCSSIYSWLSHGMLAKWPDVVQESLLLLLPLAALISALLVDDVCVVQLPVAWCKKT
jgi:hypothetical protein